MSTPLPPELSALERALEMSRAPLPPSLKARVLAAAARAKPMPRPSSLGWFAAALAIAAAVLFNFSSSAALGSIDAEQGPAAAIERCALVRALQQDPALCGQGER